ncbi:MAG: SdpI family protein [Verrucomicrobiae bacterium]|nr:SdpI family protein [Verrucomicrobiae bacterium]
MNALLVYNFFLAVLILLIAIPLALKKISPNSLYGIRISKSLKSETNWYAINEYAGKQMIVWSIVHLIFLLIVWKLSANLSFNKAVIYGGPFMPLIPIILTLIYTRKF